MKICYVGIDLRGPTLAVVKQALAIIEEYQNQGFTLTVRQIYYQFVSRDLIKNEVKSYKRLASILNDARMGGYLPWDSIEDRTRGLSSLSTWNDPSDIIESCSNQFKIDVWKDQPRRIEVWVEKEALAGVVEKVCNKYRVPYLSCRGYTSQSEMWRAAMRLYQNAKKGQELTILHLGDHDPSGIDMSRDIQDRLDIFLSHHTEKKIEFLRMALNLDQIRKFNPPPNPAKETDSRFSGYLSKYGDESWELDALEPKVITGLIEKNIKERIDSENWQESMSKEDDYRKELLEIASNLKSDE